MKELSDADRAQMRRDLKRVEQDAIEATRKAPDRRAHRVFHPQFSAPPVYYATRDGQVLTPVVLEHLGDRERKHLKQLGARLLPRRVRRAEMRRQGKPWPVMGGAPAQVKP